MVLQMLTVAKIGPDFKVSVVLYHHGLLADEGDGGSEEDADAAAGLSDQVAELVHEEHGDVSLPASSPQINDYVLFDRSLAEIQLILSSDRSWIFDGDSSLRARVHGDTRERESD